MSTGTGTFTDPIIAMSADPVQIRRDIRASLAHFNRTDDPYWIEKESTPAQFSTGLWFLGHNRYWETAMQPDDTGSRNPADGRLPALYLADVVTPPIVVPPDPPPPPPPSDTVLAMLLARLNQIDARLSQLEADGLVIRGVIANLPKTYPSFPVYSGSIFGVKITLTPK